MAFSYNPANDIGRLRLLTTDRDKDEAVLMFQDEELSVFLAIEGGNVLNAAALALEQIAASEVLIQKRIKSLDLTTDGPAEASALMKLAASYRERADALAGDGTGFEVAEIAETVFQQRERIEKEWLRSGQPVGVGP